MLSHSLFRSGYVPVRCLVARSTSAAHSSTPKSCASTSQTRGRSSPTSAPRSRRSCARRSPLDTRSTRRSVGLAVESTPDQTTLLCDAATHQTLHGDAPKSKSAARPVYPQLTLTRIAHTHTDTHTHADTHACAHTASHEYSRKYAYVRSQEVALAAAREICSLRAVFGETCAPACRNDARAHAHMRAYTRTRIHVRARSTHARSTRLLQVSRPGACRVRRRSHR